MNTFTKNTVYFLALTLFASTAPAALVAHYTLDDSEPATTVLDSSGGGNNATNSGQTFGVTGVAGTAIQAGNGIANNSDLILGPSSATEDVIGNNARTVALWFNADSISPEMAVLGFGAGSSRRQFIITVEDLGTEAGVGNTIALRYGGGNVGYNNGSDIVTGTWYHVAFVYDGTTLDFDTVDGTGFSAYINGTLMNSVDGNKGQAGNPFNTSSSELRIGNSSTDNRGFNGKIDDVQIYDSALTAGEISQIYNNPGVAIPEPGSLMLVLVAGLGMVAISIRRRR